MNLKISKATKPEPQTARITLNLTPTLKSRVVAAGSQYDTSTNSLICQLIEAGLDSLAWQEVGE